MIASFQQMPSGDGSSSMRMLLGRIRLLLKDWAMRCGQEATALHSQIALLTEQLQAHHLLPQRVVSLLVAHEDLERRAAECLWKQLMRARQEQDLLAECQELRKQVRQNYKVNQSSLNTLVKDILENIKLIEEELQHLQHNLAALPHTHSTSSPIPLYFLVRIAMADTQTMLPNDLSELVFRIYILEESTSLLLFKSQKAFRDICNHSSGESRRDSVSSQRTGVRSALSESLEVFKRNQLRVELERSDLLQPDYHREVQIQSDYKMTKKIEKCPKRGDSYAVCCFRL